MSNSNEPTPPHNPAFEKKVQQTLNEGKEIGLTREEIEQDLKENPKYQDFFAQYDEFSVKYFIDRYAAEKYLYITFAKSNAQSLAASAVEFIDQAEECLREIQNKKLFDLECLWRAEEIKIKEINHCLDFRAWDHDILSCPFIEPVTAEEVEQYIEFLQARHDKPLYWRDQGNLWEGNKEMLLEFGREVNQWFIRHNELTGNRKLLLLPDLRRPKELFYARLANERRRKIMDKSPERPPKVYSKEEKPALKYSDYEVMDDFVKRFEGRVLHQHYKNHLVYQKRGTDADVGLSEEAEMAMFQLGMIKEKVPISAHSDWRVAITRAMNQYSNAKTAAALRTVFENYEFKRANGIGFAPSRESYIREMIESYGDDILQGRKLNGEPKTFNF